MTKISISVAYAVKQQQWLKEFTMQRGASVYEAIEQSKLLLEVEALHGQSIEDLTIGIYSQKVAHDALLEDGDRVEIYRPLTADPKEVRRQLALLGKTMGKQP